MASSSESRSGAYPRRDVIVVGASAGGVQALQALVHGLSPDFPASVLIVVHVSPTSESILPSILRRAGRLPAHHAHDKQRIEHGQIYLAPPDHHMLVKPRDCIALSRRGPRENGFRPAVDPLFRTAARTCGSRTIGVILTGGLDDGTLGLIHIKEHGGLAIVQDPAEAVFPSMPESAINNVEVDHVVQVGALPQLLERLVRAPMPEGVRAMANPSDDRPDVAETGQAHMTLAKELGPPTDIICPECGGTLWELKEHKLAHYQCHVGHSFTAESLFEGKNTELENALWAALRALEESAELRRRMAARLSNAPSPLRDMRRDYERQARDSEAKASVLRALLGNGSISDRLEKATSAESEAAAAVGNESIHEEAVVTETPTRRAT